jgi:hypothetical protein
MKHFKFGKENNNKIEEYFYNNEWYKDEQETFKRIVVAPKDSQVKLILEILKNIEPPYGVLYVLVAPRTVYKEGRYQLSEPKSYKEVETFLNEFGEYIERDGRHHLWIGSTVSNELVVYDNHNIIYIYDSECEKLLRDKNFCEREFSIPVPHCHMYNKENDIFETTLMENYNWTYFPLQEEYDY